MSERLYYTDAYTSRFRARVLNHTTYRQQPAVILDQTYFYPTSGGQPCDAGELNGVRVTDVIVREADGAVLHLLAERLAGETVTAVINWPRRFDHMQHHTGQHILSQAFMRVAAAQTVGFHLSDASVTIDLDVTAVTPAQISAAEQLANQIVWEDRPVHVRFFTEAEAAALPLRKRPPAQSGALRIIDIDDFDFTACGGTHVARTGAVGLIKVLKSERRGDKLRVEFCCGGRALADYGAKQGVVADLTAQLTTGQEALATAVAKLQFDLQTAQRQLRQQQADLARLQAAALLRDAPRRQGIAIISHVQPAEAAGDARALASALAQEPTAVALLALTGGNTQFIFARGARVQASMQAALSAALAALGGGGGGGGPAFAQGGGPAADPARVQAALARARQIVVGEIEKMG